AHHLHQHVGVVNDANAVLYLLDAVDESWSIGAKADAEHFQRIAQALGGDAHVVQVLIARRIADGIGETEHFGDPHRDDGAGVLKKRGPGTQARDRACSSHHYTFLATGRPPSSLPTPTAERPSPGAADGSSCANRRSMRSGYSCTWRYSKKRRKRRRATSRSAERVAMTTATPGRSSRA